jgi:hypothetical protein
MALDFFIINCDDIGQQTTRCSLGHGGFLDARNGCPTAINVRSTAPLGQVHRMDRRFDTQSINLSISVALQVYGLFDCFVGWSIERSRCIEAPSG